MRVFGVFSYALRSGALDFDLLRPISTKFIVFGRYFRSASFLNIFVTGSIVVYFGLEVGLKAIDWVLLFPLMVAGFALMVLIEIILTCLMFWMIEGQSINFLRMEFQKLARWPDYIYPLMVRRFFILWHSHAFGGKRSYAFSL